jgi:hypothetical protein
VINTLAPFLILFLLPIFGNTGLQFSLLAYLLEKYGIMVTRAFYPIKIPIRDFGSSISLVWKQFYVYGGDLSQHR